MIDVGVSLSKIKMLMDEKKKSRSLIFSKFIKALL
jgi:hypothetical protein